VDSLKKKLLANKPKGVDVNASLGAVISVRGDLHTSTHPKGGNMGEKDGNTGEMLTLSRDDLEAAIEARINERMSAAEAQLSQTQAELHERRVGDKCRELQAAGHAPALIAKAKEYLLADTRGDGVLTLSQKDDDGNEQDVKLTVTDVVDGLLAAMPQTSLAVGGPRHLALAQTPGRGGEAKYLTPDEIKELADKVQDDLKNGKVSQINGGAL